MIYVLFVVVGMCLFYFSVFWLRKFFWPEVKKQMDVRSLWSALIIFFAGLLIIFWSQNVYSIELGNRILHALGGGFIGFLAWFLAVKNFEIPLNRISVFILGFLIISTLGVFNEIAEYVLQDHFKILIAASSVNDTWLDLVSNSLGILVSAIIFLPFYRKA